MPGVRAMIDEMYTSLDVVACYNIASWAQKTMLRYLLIKSGSVKVVVRLEERRIWYTRREEASGITNRWLPEIAHLNGPELGPSLYVKLLWSHASCTIMICGYLRVTHRGNRLDGMIVSICQLYKDWCRPGKHTSTGEYYLRGFDLTAYRGSHEGLTET